MRRLFVGPWVGEFGIELLRWHGYARTVAQREPWDEIIVATQPDRYYLYEDFATKFVPYSLPTIHTEANRCKGHVYNGLHHDYIDEKNGDVWLNPLLDRPVWDVEKHEMKKATTYINFAKRAADVPAKYDILIHARDSQKHSKNEKNWPIEHWATVLPQLADRFSMACIGTPDGALHLEGTADLRGISLEELAGYCRHAQFMLGPSSGPMHFAVLSGLPVITWVHALEPYRKKWNPFRVPLSVMPTWQPSPEVVLSKVDHLLTIVDRPRAEFFLIGTKRSGHHAVIDWLANLDSGRELVHLNDCAVDRIRSTPDVQHHVRTPFSMPKLINESRLNNATVRYHPGGKSSAALFSFEETPLARIPEIPELDEAKFLILVLRDSANFLSSLKKGVGYYSEKPFTDEAFRSILQVYREYLAEALGKTSVLKTLNCKTIFISFNRWHIDESYRRSVAARLGFGDHDADRSRISQYGPGSSFDKGKDTDARTIDVLNRWKHYASDDGFLEILGDTELLEMERTFHEDACPEILGGELAAST